MPTALGAGRVHAFASLRPQRSQTMVPSCVRFFRLALSRVTRNVPFTASRGVEPGGITRTKARRYAPQARKDFIAAVTTRGYGLSEELRLLTSAQ